MELLQTKPWLCDEILEYAIALHDKELDAALKKRMVRLRNQERSDPYADMSLHEIRTIEGERRDARMKVLPIR